MGGGAPPAPPAYQLSILCKENHKNMYKTYTKYIEIYESALPQHPSLISLVFWQCRDSMERSDIQK